MCRNSKMAGALLLLAVAISAVSCKPTENNYKAAYDAALNKRNRDADITGGQLVSLDGPRLQKVDGDSVYVLYSILRLEDAVKEDADKYNVAVGAYRMPANCDSQVEVLRERGYRSFSGEGRDGMYYAFAGAFPTIGEAAAFIRKYRSDNKGMSYVGLPGSPVVMVR